MQRLKLIAALSIFALSWTFPINSAIGKAQYSEIDREKGRVRPLSAEGTREETIVVDGEQRSYLIREPRNRDRSIAIPLVLAFHGGGGQPRSMSKLGFATLCDRENFLFVCPEGLDRHWNDNRNANTAEHNDVAFISALIDKLVRERNVDAARVYATGISNGGFFSQVLAMKIPDKITAVASVAATVPVEWKQEEVRSPMPIMFILGTKDPLIPWLGGRIGGRLFNRGQVIPAQAAIDFWLKADGLSGPPVVARVPDADPNDAVIAIRKQYGANGNVPQVIVYQLDGGGHTWPQGEQYLPAALVGRVCRDFSASEVIWNFFKQHSKRPSFGSGLYGAG